MSEIKILDKGIVKLIDHMGSDASICSAARISYSANKSKPTSSDRDLIRFLMRHHHSTPFEQATVHFYIKAPIFVLRQWHRSRTQSFNEISLRYSESSNEFYVPSPDKVTKQNPTNKQGGTDEVLPFKFWGEGGYHENILGKEDNPIVLTNWPDALEEEQEQCADNYDYYISTGMRRELARQNLPVSLYSEMVVTVNLRNLYHFINLRISEGAQYEIREYAKALLQIVKELFPLSTEAFEDYALNAKSFSKPDLEALKDLLDIAIDKKDGLDNLISLAGDHHFTNKREKQEFVDKIKNLLKV